MEDVEKLINQLTNEQKIIVLKKILDMLNSKGSPN